MKEELGPTVTPDTAEKTHFTMEDLLRWLVARAEAYSKKSNNQTEFELRIAYQSILIAILGKRLSTDESSRVIEPKLEVLKSFAAFFDTFWNKSESGTLREQLLNLLKETQLDEAITFGTKEIVNSFMAGEHSGGKTVR